MSAKMAAKRHVLITGPPGVGKTTLVCKVCEELRANRSTLKYQGFYTEEVRGSAPRKGRLGFDIVTLDGRRGPLARTKGTESARRGPSVGNYIVDVPSFEQLALSTISNRLDSSVVVVDEIGKMELFSQPFTQAIRELYASSDVAVLATVPVARQHLIPLVEQLKQRSDVTLVEVSKSNRDSLVEEVVDLIEAGAANY